MGIGTLRRYYPENQPAPAYTFSGAASKLLAEAGIAEAEYDGEATGANGDVLKSDVQAFLEEREG